MARVRDIDRGWKRIKKDLNRIDGAKTKVGINANVRISRPGEKINNAELGAIHEFGAPRRNIPERSFLRATYDTNIARLNAKSRDVYSKVVRNSFSVRDGLRALGKTYKDMVIAVFNNPLLPPPPLKPATIAKKGSANPLVDSGTLKDAISQVEEIPSGFKL